MERGQQLAAAREEKRKLLAPATELLREQGLSDLDIERLSEDERLVAAGVMDAPPAPRRASMSSMIAEGRAATAEMHDNLVAAGEITESGGSDE